MLLKRISSALPVDLHAYIPVLESAGIKTTENLIFTPRSTLDDLIPSLPEHVIDDIVRRCTQITTGQEASGAEEMEEEKGKRVGWGGFGADSLTALVGEWDGVGVVELSGQRRVGKSLIALHSALRVLAGDDGSICHWLDTDGSFSPDRAKLILESWGVPDPKSVLKRMIVTPCFRLDPDIHQALSTVRESLEKDEDEPEGSGHARIRVLVVDQITSLFKDHITNTNSGGQAAMLTVMEDIAELTYTHHLTTFITNGHASSVPTNSLSRFSATSIKPALGTAFTFTADISLLVQETGKLFGMIDATERERARSAPGLRGVVEVLKSRVSPQGRWAVFETDGIRLLEVAPPPLEDERTLRQSAGMQVGEARPSMGPLAQTLAP